MRTVDDIHRQYPGLLVTRLSPGAVRFKVGTRVYNWSVGEFDRVYPARDPGIDALPVSMLADLFQDKSVVIVGSGPIAGQGAFIDAHDTVVRINNNWLTARANQTDLGQRASVIFHCLGARRSEDVLDPDATGSVPVVCAFRSRHRADKVRQLREAGFTGALYAIPDDWWLQLPPRPHTGTAALWYALTAGASRVSTVGITFYRGEQLYDPRVKAWDNDDAVSTAREYHPLDDELRHLQRAWALGEIPAFNPCPALRAIIAGPEVPESADVIGEDDADVESPVSPATPTQRTGDPRTARTQAAIRAYLADHPGSTVTAVATAIDVHENTARRQLHALANQGHVRPVAVLNDVGTVVKGWSL